MDLLLLGGGSIVVWGRGLFFLVAGDLFYCFPCCQQIPKKLWGGTMEQCSEAIGDLEEGGMCTYSLRKKSLDLI